MEALIFRTALKGQQTIDEGFMLHELGLNRVTLLLVQQGFLP